MQLYCQIKTLVLLAFCISCSIQTPPQILLVVHFRDGRSIDVVSHELAQRLNMRITISGRGLFNPPEAEGYEIYDNNITIALMPGPLDRCAKEQVYDGKSFDVNIAAESERTAMYLAPVEGELRAAVQRVGGTLTPPTQC